MATVVAGISAASTSNNAALTTGSFTPAAGDLLVAFAVVSGQAGGGTFTDSQGLGWAPVATALKATSADTLVCAVSNARAAASAMTVTFTPAGAPTSTGVALSVLRVSGMSRAGLLAVRQSASQANQSAGTPAPAFAVACRTADPAVGAVGNGTSPAGLVPPAGGTAWTEAHDVGYSTPTTGLETAFLSSGFAGTTVTWGGASASAFASLVVELDASAPLVDDDAPAAALWPDQRAVGVYS